MLGGGLPHGGPGVRDKDRVKDRGTARGRARGGVL
jgi:hypothetical protein